MGPFLLQLGTTITTGSGNSASPAPKNVDNSQSSPPSAQQTRESAAPPNSAPSSTTHVSKTSSEQSDFQQLVEQSALNEEKISRIVEEFETTGKLSESSQALLESSIRGTLPADEAQIDASSATQAYNSQGALTDNAPTTEKQAERINQLLSLGSEDNTQTPTVAENTAAPVAIPSKQVSSNVVNTDTETDTPTVTTPQNIAATQNIDNPTLNTPAAETPKTAPVDTSTPLPSSDAPTNVIAPVAATSQTREGNATPIENDIPLVATTHNTNTQTAATNVSNNTNNPPQAVLGQNTPLQQTAITDAPTLNNANQIAASIASDTDRRGSSQPALNTHLLEDVAKGTPINPGSALPDRESTIRSTTPSLFSALNNTRQTIGNSTPSATQTEPNLLTSQAAPQENNGLTIKNATITTGLKQEAGQQAATAAVDTSLQPSTLSTNAASSSVVDPLQVLSDIKSTSAPATTPTQSQPHATPAEQVNIQFSKALEQGQTTQKITVQLDPASLGKVELQFDVIENNKASVLVIADKSETLDMLQRDSRAIERLLQDAGLKTDSNSLSFDLREQHQNKQDFADGTKQPSKQDKASAAEEYEATNNLIASGAYLNLSGDVALNIVV